MAYGRLDVYWPDGKFESFDLNTPSVSVGRSSGCTIVLETDTISRYHFSITQEADEVKISDLDSVNGTYVDGVLLPANQSQTLHGGEELQIGHLRMIYHNATDQPTMPMSDLAEDTQQRFEADDIGFHIEVYGPEIAVPPGSHTSVEVTVNNNTDQPRRYTVKVTGLPEGWARVNRPELVVDADESSPVVINLKPLRRSDSTPGEYPMTVTVALKDDPEKRIDAELTFRVLPYTGFGMALASKHITGNDTFKLHVHNQGSIGLPLYILGRSRDESLQFTIPKPQIMLAPGERQVIQGGVKPVKRRAFGGTQELPFDVLVRSRDESAFLAAIRGYYVDKTTMPRWAAGSIVVGLLGVFVLLALAVVLLLSRPALEPEILRFETQTGILTQGDMLLVSWDVENTERVNILVNGTPVIVNAPESTRRAELPTGSYTGEITLRLEALRGSESVSRTLIVNVLEHLHVEYFEVIPATLVRNVVGQITVRWRVQGATLTRIEGAEALLGAGAIEPSSGPEGSINLNGVATENFSITLIAQDDQGNEKRQSLNVDLINPECTTIEDNYRLYALPDEFSNVVSTVQQGVVFVVDRRDESGAWLRTQLPGGVVAWGARTGVQCSDAFSPDALRIEVTQSQPATPEAEDEG